MEPTNPHISFSGLQDSFDLVKPHVNPKTGIIPWTRLLPTPYAGDSFHICVAKHPIINEQSNINYLKANINSYSSAIGKTKDQAKMLAVFEGLERWSCVSQGGEYAELQSLNEISSDAVDPQKLHCISDTQYLNRSLSNKSNQSGGGFIPEPLDRTTKVLWCPVYDILNDRWKYVLKSSCYFGHNDQGHLFSVADSRGVAAGPNPEFCIWNGLLELIETDAGAIWNANRIICPEVEVKSFEDPFLMELIEIHNQLERDVWVLDITMDMKGVHTLATLSKDRKNGNIIKGFGTHPIAHHAIKKAIMECCQMLPNVTNLDGHDESLSSYKLMSSSSNTTKKSIPSHFLPDNTAKKINAIDYQNKTPISTLNDLFELIQARGLTPLIHDTSRPEIGLHTIRVLVPGMRSWFDRRAPGRLYTVPVNLGLRKAPELEENLYDIPVSN